MKLILLSIRSLTRFRLYTVVSMLGLAFSLACFIFIFRYVYSEVTADHYIKDINHIFFLIQEAETTHNKSIIDGNKTAGWMSPNPLEDKHIEFSSTFYVYDGQVTVDERSYSAASFAVDTNFLKLITLPILKSNGTHLLSKPSEAILSESLAEKLFGKEEPIGKTILSSKNKLLTVTGIFKEPETKTSFSFDMLETSEPQDKEIVASIYMVRLRKGTDWEALNTTYSTFQKVGGDERHRVQFFPLKDLYFDNELITYLPSRTTGNTVQLLLLSIVTLLILFVGIFNYINIYTTLMQKRAREFGMKKVFGANGRQMMVQLYAENFSIAVIALFIAWVLVELGTIIALAVGLSTLSNSTFNVVLSIGILFLLPLITAAYPFVRYNYSTPIHSIRSVGKAGHSTLSRNLFLCAQYMITIGLIIASLFFIRQLSFMLNKDVGYTSENILVVPGLRPPSGIDMSAWNKYLRKIEYISNELKQSTLIPDFSFSPTPSGFSTYSYRITVPGGKSANVQAESSSESQFRLLGFKLREGRIWNDSIDSFKDFTVIINESAKKELGITDITKETIVSESFFVWYTGIDNNRKPEYRIIGVIEDFYTEHLSKKAAPFIFYYYSDMMQSSLLVKVQPEKKQETITWLKQLYNEINGDTFHYTFLADEVRALYNSDTQFTFILTFFATIAILISLMGLFSLSLFDIQERQQEIAIRKINGATTQSILLLLLKKYCILLIISFLIAAPIAWLAITNYMESFANKVPVSWDLFAIAFIFTVTVSLLTLIWQIQKASETNPAEIIHS